MGDLTGAVEDELEVLAADQAVTRIWAKDHTLWQADQAEVADRLGWLHSPREMLDRVGELESFAAGLQGNGFRHVVVLGMGGSSLFPEVMAQVFGDGEVGLDLRVLDTTDPGAVLGLEAALDLAATLFVVASKSGTTIETRSHLAHFWERVPRPGQFVAVTDPGSPLATFAREHGFRAVFENQPDLGGRYSALSHFGLVPAALAGVEVEELLRRALAMAEACQAPEPENPGVRLGAMLGVAARHGRDKATMHLAEGIAPFGAWLEQLLAESTGKHGTGILPVDLEPPRPVVAYGADRVFVSVGPAANPDPAALASAGHPVVGLTIDDPYDLGAEVFRWELAAAVAGRVLSVNPFDQPDVASAKQATDRVLRDGLPPVPMARVADLLDGLAPPRYLAVQAYVDPGSPLAAALRTAAHALGASVGVATTFGIGPRYLHSTGQFHKGGPPTGVFLQVVGDDAEDLAVPGQAYSFSTLKQAQAAGDLAALRERGLVAGRVDVADLLTAGDLPPGG